MRARKPGRGWAGAALVAVACAASPAPPPAGLPDLPAVLRLVPKVPALPNPTGPVVRVRTARGLVRAVRAAQPGTTILLADGTYRVHELLIDTDRLSLRGQSGQREKVILDAGGRFTKVIRIRGAKDVLIADLTVANSAQYGIFFLGDSDVQRLRVYNVKFHNCWVRGLKGTHPARIDDSYTRSHPPEVARKVRPAGGQVRYCLFVNDRVNPHTRPYGGDYIGGIDVMGAKDWVIADNVFVNIRGRRGGGRGAVFLWVGSENDVVERNVIVNCDRGVCFGNPSGRGPHMTGGIVRNNFIVAGSSEAIEICQARNTKVYNNTIYCARPRRRAIQFHKGVPGGRCVNNLVRGALALPEEVVAENNLTGDLEGWFANPAVGDLHLTARAAAARGKGKPLEEVIEDFDRQRRKRPPDIGADEYHPGAPPRR